MIRRRQATPGFHMIVLLVTVLATVTLGSVDRLDATATTVTGGSTTHRLVTGSSHTLDTSGSGSNRRDSRRRLDEEIFNEQDVASNSTAAYVKCYSLIDEVTAESESMQQDDYLLFLRLLTGGEISYDRFADLPAAYVMIFYTAACAEGEDCTPGNEPEIRLNEDEQGEPSEVVQLFCKQLLKSTQSNAEAVFDYTIRYNPERIATQDLAVCLSTATVNVLLEQLGSCPLLAASDTPSERHRQLHAVELQSDAVQSRRWSTLQAGRRRLQSLGSVATPDDADCKYSIDSTVDRITELPCDEIEVVGGNSTDENADEVCGLVGSTAVISASLLLEPFDELLRIKAVQILRRVINGGEFLTYLPDECLLV